MRDAHRGAKRKSRQITRKSPEKPIEEGSEKSQGHIWGLGEWKSSRRAFFRAALPSPHNDRGSERQTDLLKTAFSPIVCAGIERVQSEARKYEKYPNGEPLFSFTLAWCEIARWVQFCFSSRHRRTRLHWRPSRKQHEKNKFSDEIVSSCFTYANIYRTFFIRTKKS